MRQPRKSGMLAAALAVVCAALVASGCGAESDAGANGAPGTAPRDARIDGDTVGCTLADVSDSTVRARREYTAEFARFATALGEKGAGRVCLVVAAGDPLAESKPMWAPVGPSPEHRDSPDLAPGEIQASVAAASRDVGQMLAHPPAHRGGSALVEGAVVAGRVLQPGDVLQFLSDGMQNSAATGSFYRRDLSPSGIRQLLDTLQQQGLIAHLDGVQVVMPLVLYHPGGTGTSAPRQTQVTNFWRAWAARAGATLTLTERPSL